MATSIQRLAIMVIILDLLLVMTGIFVYSTNDAILQTEAEQRIVNYQNWSYDLEEGFPNPTPDSQSIYLDRQFGDVKFGGRQVFNILKEGLEIRSTDECFGEDCSVEYKKWIITAIILFYTIINAVLGLEIFFIFYSKKYT